MSKPTSEDNPSSLQVIETIHQLSHQILEACQAGNFVQANQQLDDRGTLIEQARLAEIHTCEEPIKLRMAQILKECEDLEVQILQYLEIAKTNLDDQSISLQQSKNLIDRYKLDSLTNSTRQHQA